MYRVSATPADDGTVAPFGRYLSLGGPTTDTKETISRGRWVNLSSRIPVLESPATIGRTRAGVVPFVCTAMERHRGTCEVIVCLKGSLVLAATPPGPSDAPLADQVTALAMYEGDVVVLDAGVWHDACRGIDGAADYLWIATSGVSPIEDRRWVPLDGGEVTVQAPDVNGGKVPRRHAGP